MVNAHTHEHPSRVASSINPTSEEDTKMATVQVEKSELDELRAMQKAQAKKKARGKARRTVKAAILKLPANVTAYKEQMAKAGFPVIAGEDDDDE